MKYRTGWVSNSSSSSFVIWTRGDVDTTQEIEKAFNVDIEKGHPLYSIFGKITKVILNNIDEMDMDRDAYIKERGYDSEEEALEDGWGYDEDVKKKFDDGWKVSIGGFSDECDGISSFLCNEDIDYKSDTLEMHQQGGY